MSEPRRRAFLAVAIPLGALVGGAVIVWSISRILLASDLLIAPVIGILVAINVLIGAALAAAAGSRRAVRVLVAALVVPILAFGVVGAVVGERPVEPHHAAEPPEEPAAPPEQPPPPDEPPTEQPEEPGPAEPQEEVTIVAQNVAFDLSELVFPANTEVTITMVNDDGGIPHNISIYTVPGGDVIHEGEIITEGEVQETFTTPDPGTYYFVCDLHPNMNGTVRVV